jgi:lysophospholipase L1-like esterase
MWTETEVTGFGIFPYVESAIFMLKTGLKDGEWTVTFANPEKEPVLVNCYADEVLMIKDEKIEPGSERKISFSVCSIHEVTSLQFFVSDPASAKEDSKERYLYIKDIDYRECPSKTPRNKPFIFLASDSTVQTYEEYYYPQTGWGQVFCRYFCPDQELKEYMSEDRIYPQCHVYERESLAIENRAIGARSARSFIDEGKWNALLMRACPGDYCFIQWAHNDATAVRPNRYVAPQDFDGFLMEYIDSCRSRGITAVLVTPVSRRNCDENGGSFPLSFGEYRDVILEVGKREHVPVIDLGFMSNEYMKKVGPEEAKSLHLWCPGGVYTEGAYADGVSDNTHLQEYGALVYAKMVAQALLDMKGFPEIDAIKGFINTDEVPKKKTYEIRVKPVSKEVPTGFAVQELHVEDKVANFLLVWNDVEGAVSYNVYRKGSVDFQFFPLESVSAKEKRTATVLPFRLPASDVYQVRVTAVFEDGRESAPGRTIEFRT